MTTQEIKIKSLSNRLHKTLILLEAKMACRPPKTFAEQDIYFTRISKLIAKHKDLEETVAMFESALPLKAAEFEELFSNATFEVSFHFLQVDSLYNSEYTTMEVEKMCSNEKTEETNE